MTTTQAATIATLLSPQLRLTPIDAAHEALYLALYSSPRVMARIAEPLDPAGASAAFDRALAAHRAACPTHLTWAVQERRTGRDVGIGALAWRRDDVELGLMLLPSAWNARYSHDVIGALVAHAIDDLGIARLTGICQAGPNERMSRRLLRPHGFVEAVPDRPRTARWILDAHDWTRPVGIHPADR